MTLYTLKQIAHSGLVLILLATAASPCWAVIIYEKGKEQRIRGYLVRENDARVVVNQVLPDGRIKQIILPRTAIDDIIHSVDPKRLADLDPSNAHGYRDYAEELSERRIDPDAQVTAIRLYLIAAHLNRAELGRGSLLGMADLARTPAEERSFRAMAYLLDADHDRSVLTDAVAASPASEDTLDSRQRELLLKGLRALRGGRSRKREATSRGNAPQFKQLLSGYRAYLSHEEFVAAAKDASGRLSPGLLKRILTLELVLLNADLPGPATAQTSGPWSGISIKDLQGRVPALNLETITEFNPRQCVFRKAEWVEP